MKVMLVNGSPHPQGCTYTALSEIAGVLDEEGIQSEIFWLGVKPISGCLGCGVCLKTGQCVIDDCVNEFLPKAYAADALVVGSPVHFASASGMMTSFMDRVFYGRTAHFRGKPGAAVVTCRRGGATAAFDQLGKYFTISGMPVVSSQYWNMVHGNTPDEIRQDAEGLQIMRTLGRHMAWMLKCIEAGERAGIKLPELEAPLRTNFIRP